jgi:hypothetical protein
MSKMLFQRSQADRLDLTDLDCFKLPGARHPLKILDIVAQHLSGCLNRYTFF